METIEHLRLRRWRQGVLPSVEVARRKVTTIVSVVAAVAEEKGEGEGELALAAAEERGQEMLDRRCDHCSCCSQRRCSC